MAKLNQQNAQDTEAVVVLTGWISRKAKKVSKTLAFGQLRDTDGDLVQLVGQDDQAAALRQIPTESPVIIKGKAQPKQGGSGEIELVINEVQVLNPASVLASQLADGTKSWPAQYRYMQLREPAAQQKLKRRAQINRICRDHLDNDGFTEVETPMLFKSTPEGAKEFLVPTRTHGHCYALPQSPQQFKQMLMASGVSRYYQIARCFRDEDLRADRQPEFTQLDMELAFAGANEVMASVEPLINRLVEQTTSTKLYTLDDDGKLVTSAPLRRMPYAEAMAKYGTDKPDLRYGYEIQDLAPWAVATEHPDFNVPQALVIKQGKRLFNTEKALDDSHLLASLQASDYSGRLPRFAFSADKALEILSTFADVREPGKIVDALAFQDGDIVALSTRGQLQFEMPSPLGWLRDSLIASHPKENIRNTANGQQFDVTKNFVSIWVTDFPLFTPDGGDAFDTNGYPIFDNSSLVTNHHPFTMVKMDDYELLETSPLEARSEHYDLVVNGVEVGGGSTRVHDAELQRYIFKSLLRIDKPERVFGHLLEAFTMGCPPHAGMALGLDRLTAMLSYTPFIRDVIAFPKTITGADPLFQVPSKIPNGKLKLYGLEWKK